MALAIKYWTDKQTSNSLWSIKQELTHQNTLFGVKCGQKAALIRVDPHFILTLVKSSKPNLPPPRTDTHTFRFCDLGSWTTGRSGSNDFTAADLTQGGCSVSDDPRGLREADSQNIGIKVWPWEIQRWRQFGVDYSKSILTLKRLLNISQSDRDSIHLCVWLMQSFRLYTMFCFVFILGFSCL